MSEIKTRVNQAFWLNSHGDITVFTPEVQVRITVEDLRSMLALVEGEGELTSEEYRRISDESTGVPEYCKGDGPEGAQPTATETSNKPPIQA